MLDKFLQKWNGKYCEVAGSANAINQCTDLCNAYLRDVLKLSIVEWTNAIDFPSKLTESHEWIPNTPDGIPQLGDLIVWGKGAGHIAIFLSGTVSKFTSFEQNYPTGSPCHAQGHTYANVLGWLRFRGIIDDMPSYLDSLLREDLGLDIKKSEGDVRARVSELKTAYDKYEEQEQEIKKLEGRILSLGQELGGLEEGLTTAVKNRNKFEKEAKEEREKVINRDKIITILEKEVDTLKKTLDPDSKVVVSKEEYDKLTKTSPLDAHTNKELKKELRRRRLRVLQAWIKKWFTLPMELKKTKEGE